MERITEVNDKVNDMNQHLSADQLIDRMYGLDTPDHDCPQCAERLQQLLAMRASAAEAPVAPNDFLAAQRRNVYARMGEQPRARMKWLPALAAAACLITAGIFTLRPEAQVAKPEIDDAQLFTDVYSMEQSMEPIAAKPIHAIFEDQQ
jgi:hypothetical protein